MNKTPNFIHINLRFLTDDLHFEEKLVTKRANGNKFHQFDIMKIILLKYISHITALCFDLIMLILQSYLYLLAQVLVLYLKNTSQI